MKKLLLFTLALTAIYGCNKCNNYQYEDAAILSSASINITITDSFGRYYNINRDSFLIIDFKNKDTVFDKNSYYYYYQYYGSMLNFNCFKRYDFFNTDIADKRFILYFGQNNIDTLDFFAFCPLSECGNRSSQASQLRVFNKSSKNKVDIKSTSYSIAYQKF